MGQGFLPNTVDADILEYILVKLVARIAAKDRTFLVKVKGHRGEPLNVGTHDLTETGRSLAKEGEGYRWRQRTTRLEFSQHGARKWRRGLFEGQTRRGNGGRLPSV